MTKQGDRGQKLVPYCLAALLLAALVAGVGFAGLVDTSVARLLFALTLALGLGLLLRVALTLLAVTKEPSPKTGRLWELEDVYSTISIQLASHRRRREEAWEEGRRAFAGGEIGDRELAYLENTYDDLRDMHRQVVAAYFRAGGSQVRLREIDARLEKNNREFELVV